jgi:hypothetical protein
MVLTHIPSLVEATRRFRVAWAVARGASEEWLEPGYNPLLDVVDDALDVGEQDKVPTERDTDAKCLHVYRNDHRLWREPRTW